MITMNIMVNIIVNILSYDHFRYSYSYYHISSFF